VVASVLLLAGGFAGWMLGGDSDDGTQSIIVDLEAKIDGLEDEIATLEEQPSDPTPTTAVATTTSVVTESHDYLALIVGDVRERTLELRSRLVAITGRWESREASFDETQELVAAWVADVDVLATSLAGLPIPDWATVPFSELQGMSLELADIASQLPAALEASDDGSQRRETTEQFLVAASALDTAASVLASPDEMSATPTIVQPTPTTAEPVPLPTADLVGVYYYPWHQGDFHGRNYLREHLVPVQAPALGEYDDRQADVIRQHLEWSREAGIDVWVTSWWGRGSPEDVTTRDAILAHPDLGAMQIAVHYETAGTTDEYSNMGVIQSDFRYLAQRYFDHHNYLKIDGRPVVIVYLTRVLADLGSLDQAVADMRAAAASEGHDVYIVGDHAFGEARQDSGLGVLDAVTNYDVYGSMGVTGVATSSDVNSYLADQIRWRDMADRAGVAFVPSATPGFNDTAVRTGHTPLSRMLVGADESGSLFRSLVEGAVPLRDDRAAGLLMVTSWNEWHEDTQIEPVEAAAATTTDDSPNGQSYTHGIAYEGYGTRYLAILRETLGAP